MKKNSCTKILIIGASWVGDMVMAQTLLIFLKKKHPESQIDVMAPPWSKDVLLRMPEVDNHLDLPLKHGELKIPLRYKIGKKLREDKYTNAYILPNSLKSALIPFFAKIKIRTGWKGESRYLLLNDIKILDKKSLNLMIDRFVALGLDKNKHPKKQDLPKLISPPKLISNKTHKSETLKKLNYKKTNKKIISLCPGAAFGPAKQWPAKYHASVANEMIKKGWEIWILGAGKDVEIINEINSLTNNKCISFCNKGSLANAIDLLAMSDLVITNDSGLMHIACAVNTPVVAIYGSTSPDFTPPLSDNNIILGVNPKELTCRPCFQRTCRFDHYKCLNDISPKLVLDALNNLQNKDKLQENKT